MALFAMVFRPCAWCWGSGTLLRNAGNGEGLIPTKCDNCAGVGHTLDVPVVINHARDGIDVEITFDE